MRPTFFGFETARRAIAISQKGIDITGQNLGNQQTPGYTRQRIDQYSMAMGSSSYAYATNSATFAGQGVNMSGVAQIRDPFLDNYFRVQSEGLGEISRISSTLTDLENSLDEISAADLTTAMQKMEDQLGKLQSEAGRPEIANVFMTSSKNLSQILGQLSGRLDKIAQQQKHELDSTTNKFNAILDKLNELNVAIVDEYKNNSFFSGGPIGTEDRMPNSMYGPNELLDDRNLLLDELASYSNLEIITNNDQSVSINMGDFKLLDGKTNNVYKLKVVPDSGKEVSAGDKVSIEYSGFTKDGARVVEGGKNSNILDTGNLTSGQLKGFMSVMNGRGVYGTDPASNDFKGIGYYKDNLDAFAAGFAKAMNAANSYSEGKRTVTPPGREVTFRSAGDIGSATPAPANHQFNIAFDNTVAAGGTPSAAWAGTAPNSSLTISLVAGATYSADDINKIIATATGTPPPGSAGINVDFKEKITAEQFNTGIPAGNALAVEFVEKNFFQGDADGKITSSNIRLTKGFMDNPLSWITNSKTAGAGGQDNSNLLAMSKIFDTKLEFGKSPAGDTVYIGKPSEFISFYTLGLGEEKSYYDGLLKVSMTTILEIDDRRNNVSAVNPDEEGINMMTYSKAFNAASRLMTTLDEALDTIINRMGIVGR